jgi:flagellin-specific chaperone FliS
MNMGAAFPSMLDRLVSALNAALVACSAKAGREALDEAFGVLGALYASLDSGRHPELSAYLQFVYDGCFRSIGEASAGRCEGLTSAITLLGHIRRAEEGAQRSAWPVQSPSFIARAIAV